MTTRIVVLNIVMLLIDGLLLSRVRSRPNFVRLTQALLSMAIAGALLAAVVLDGFARLDFLSHVVFGHVALVLLATALFGARRRILMLTCLAALLMDLSIATDAFLVEPQWLQVSRHVLRSDEVTSPVRIVVLADFQTDELTGYEREVIGSIVRERADIALLAGDYLQTESLMERDRLSSEFRGLMKQLASSTRLGAYAVQGNVDAPGWEELFGGTGVHTLQGVTTRRVGELALTGLGLDDSFNPTLELPTPDGFHIVFGHSPDYALGTGGGDLLVAGHTHGGQVRLPFVGPLITLARVPRAWAAGRTALDNGRQLIVSRGTGMERGDAPRMRFLCRPELLVIDVLPDRA